MAIPILLDIVIILGLAVPVLFVCHQLRVPAIVGFLLTGILAGPHGLSLIRTPHEVEILAEVGVVLLLFTIGIEFSSSSLWHLKRSVLMGGTTQVLLSILVTVLVARHFGLGWHRSVFFGFLASLSSTAIVLKLFQEKAEIESPHGKTGLAILIFQDIVAVPMMLMIPLIAGVGGESGATLLVLLAKALGIVCVALVSARWIVPHLFYHVARTRSRELFLLTVIVLCFAIAVLTAGMGLSLALGAFLAGLILSESEYSHQALSNVLPFRDIFTSIFFISIGMLMNVRFFILQPVLILAIALGVMGMKTITAGLAAALLGFPLRTIILTGFALNQVGEFSFILSRAGLEFGLLSEHTYGLFLAVSVLTMAATPFVTAAGPRLADRMARLPLPKRLKAGLYPVVKDKAAGKQGFKDHLIIIGYGVNGRNVARAAKEARIPYVIVEMNPMTVRIERANNEPIVYGDASQEAVLEHAGVERARVMVVGIPDPAATRMAIASARRLCPKLHIIARTRFLQELHPLRELGANEVIPEEFETSVEIFSRVLAKYLVPREEIEMFVAKVRKEGYGMLRSLSPEATALCPEPTCDLRFYFPDLEISALLLKPGAPAEGKTPAELALRQRYGVTLLAIRRDSRILSNPGAQARLHIGDICIFMGTPEHIIGVESLFEGRSRAL